MAAVAAAKATTATQHSVLATVTTPKEYEAVAQIVSWQLPAFQITDRVFIDRISWMTIHIILFPDKDNSLINEFTAHTFRQLSEAQKTQIREKGKEVIATLERLKVKPTVFTDFIEVFNKGFAHPSFTITIPVLQRVGTCVLNAFQLMSFEI